MLSGIDQIGINLLLTFTISGISIGGHLGGLIGGGICGMLVIAGERGYFGSNARIIEYGGMILIGVLSVVFAISASEPVPNLVFAALAT